MKKVMVLVAAAVASFILISCASSGIAAVDTTINVQDIDITSMNREDYAILGYVSGEGSVIASDKLIAEQRSGIRPSKRINLKNDTFRYGYTGSSKPYAMTAEETAVANATYKMIKQAESNGADTVAFIQTHISIIPNITDSGKQSVFDPESTISAKVTGIAIKIKTENQALQPAPVAEQEDLDPAATFKFQKANAEKLAREKTEAEAEARRKAIREQKEKEAEEAALNAAEAESKDGETTVATDTETAATEKQESTDTTKESTSNTTGAAQ